jgi:ElaB/YqjD/DUF883 family membrane-anchored ribosome-binding protein
MKTCPLHVKHYLLLVGGLIFIGGLIIIGSGCTEKKSATEKMHQHVEEQMEHTADNIENRLDKIDGEGALQEAAEEVEEFGDDIRESIEENTSFSFSDDDTNRIRERIRSVVAQTRSQLDAVGTKTENTTENSVAKIRQITAEGMQKLEAVADSIGDAHPGS